MSKPAVDESSDIYLNQNFGISNVGGYSCYINSTIQMLFTIIEFKKYILNINYFKKKIIQAYGEYKPVIYESYCFYWLYKLLNPRNEDDGSSSSGSLSSVVLGDEIRDIRNIIDIFDKRKNKDDFIVNEQNDVWEFINLFFNMLHSEFYKIEHALKLEDKVDVSDKTSFITHVFKINYSFIIHNFSGSFELVQDHEDYEAITSRAMMDKYMINILLNDKDIQKLSEDHLTLQNLLNLSLAAEPKADKHGYSQYILEKRIREYSTYIIICINRFEGDMSKNLIKFNIPRTINIYDRSFNIISVICHNGANLNSGHYINYSERNGNWFLFNDRIVEHKCSEEIFHLISGGTDKTDEYRKVDNEENDTPYILLCKITENFQSLLLTKRS